jgi:hypothetical protein
MKIIGIKYNQETYSKKFFLDLLTNFLCFDLHAEYYRQKQGISMGSKISPFLANVFCHMMDAKKIVHSKKVVKF